VKPWEVIGRTHTPEGTELTLARHPSEFVILAGGQNLMSSRMHASEEALAVLGCRRARTLPRSRVLVGGLGMGFTLRAALDTLPADADVVVSELLPAVIEWNRGPLGPLASHPLDDPRVRVSVGDVAAVMRACPEGFDAVLLDVDNGLVAMTTPANAGLYDTHGVAVARASLAPGGVLACWSAGDDTAFERRLRAAGLHVERHHVRSRGRKGARHTIVLASRDGASPVPSTAAQRTPRAR
jgi:spermidine synthase